MRIFLFVLLVGPLVAQTPQPAPIDPIATAACASAATHVPPPVIPASSKDKAWLMSCDSFDLYYGTKRAPDFTAARRCALFQSELNLKAGGFYEYGEAPLFTLAMIYANGEGVQKDLDIPLHFVCRGSTTYRRGDGWVDFIDFLDARKANQTAPRFDYCRGKLPVSEPAPDLAYDKLDDMDCEAVIIDLADRQRNLRLAAMIATWTPEQQFAYRSARQASDRYARAEGEDEAQPCASGTESERMEGRTAIHKEFADDMERFGHGGLPPGTVGDSIRAEAELNSLYRQSMGAIRAESGDCAHSPAPLRDAERAWMAYRDAWIRFAQVQWPAVSRENWIAFLDRERIARMKSEH